MLQAGAAKAGLEIKVVAEPYTSIAPKLDDPERAHDLIPLWRSAYFADPHNWTGFLFNSNNFKAGNASFYKNPRIDELTDKALAVTDQEQRRPLYEEASRILVELGLKEPLARRAVTPESVNILSARAGGEIVGEY